MRESMRGEVSLHATACRDPARVGSRWLPRLTDPYPIPPLSLLVRGMRETRMCLTLRSLGELGP